MLDNYVRPGQLDSSRETSDTVTVFEEPGTSTRSVKQSQSSTEASLGLWQKLTTGVIPDEMRPGK